MIVESVEQNTRRIRITTNSVEYRKFRKLPFFWEKRYKFQRYSRITSATEGEWYQNIVSVLHRPIELCLNLYLKIIVWFF